MLFLGALSFTSTSTGIQASTITISCAGVHFTIDGHDPSEVPHTTDSNGNMVFTWLPNGQYNITEISYYYNDNAISIPTGFQSNSIGTTAKTSIIYTVPANSETILMTWESNYRITFTTNGQGTVQPSGSQIYNANQVVPISAVPAQGWQFTGWTTTIPNNYDPFTGRNTTAIDIASEQQTHLTAVDGGTVTANFQLVSTASPTPTSTATQTSTSTPTTSPTSEPTTVPTIQSTPVTPEFPALIIVPLFLVVLLAALVVKKDYVKIAK